MEKGGSESDEFDDLDQVSRIALLIDDLNNEDPLAQQNSIEQLESIVQVLGVDRCVEELLPMLTELIDKIDNNTELLLHLATQLGNLTKTLGPEKAIHLSQPLELIGETDDHIVRNKAVEGLKKVCEIIPNSIHETQFLEVITRLAKGDLYSMRISAGSLFKTSLEKASPELTQKLKELYFELCKDDTPMVRRAAAQALKDFIEVTRDVSETLRTTFNALLEDQQDAVKTETIKASVVMIDVIKQEGGNKQEVIETIHNAVKNSTSWRLRFAVCELIPKLAETVGREDTDASIVDLLENLLRDKEAEVRSEALHALGPVCQVCSPEQIISKLIIPISTELVTDSSVHVRVSLAESICKLSEKMITQDVIDHIIPNLTQLMKDQHTEVRLALMSHIGLVT